VKIISFGTIALAAVLMLRSTVSAMTMTVAGDQLILSGQIVPEDAARFASLVDANPNLKTVVLWDSPGGAAGANDAITAVIEAHNLDTVVTGYCVSACAMVFLAGTNRFFGDRNPLSLTSLGFHANYVRGGELGSDARRAALKQRVIDRTGGKIDPALVDRWLHLSDPRNTIRFRYPNGTTTSVFFCPLGRFPNEGRYDGCEAIRGTDALASGIITSTQVYHVH